jgi:hypothetical protein
MAYVSEELTHFVGRHLVSEDDKFRLLVRILQTGWLQAGDRRKFSPGFILKADSSKNLTANDAVEVPVVCFCDIPRDDLAIHMEK